MNYLAARGPDTAVAIVAIVFVFVYLILRIATREREQKRRLDLVAQALQAGQLDERLRHELLGAVAAPGPKTPIWVVLGWLGLFAGIGLLIVAATTNERDMWPAGIMVTAVSFAVLSLPIAAREMQGRKTAASPRVE